MNETTILVWINIAIVGIIAIIIVKLYFRKDELEKDDSPLLSKDSLNKLSQSSENNLSKTAPNKSFVSTYFSKQDQPKGTSLRKQGQIPDITSIVILFLKPTNIYFPINQKMKKIRRNL